MVDSTRTYLQGNFLKEKKQRNFLKGLMNLDFVQRFFVYNSSRGTIAWYKSEQDCIDKKKPNGEINLVDLIAVYQEEPKIVATLSKQQLAERFDVKNPVLKRPKGWEFVLDLETHERTWRLFSDSYDVQKQWFHTLRSFIVKRN